MNLDQYLPSTFQNMITSYRSSKPQGENGGSISPSASTTQMNRMSVNQMLKQKQSKGKINFDKLPKRIMLSCIKPEIADEQGDQEE